MTFQKLPPDEVGKGRFLRLSDKIYNMIVKDHGSLAKYLRKYEQIDKELKKLGHQRIDLSKEHQEFTDNLEQYHKDREFNRKY